ncbi:MAG TPA: zinc-ribbon domain containing protein [Dehalococcoidia bacterium]|nr:zinc-ribbon domain containing protein [Dehalococcoidia bacterium]
MKELDSKQYFRDKVIRCCDCGQSFIFTAGEQAYYYSKQLSEPKRCQACRDLRKRTILPREVRDG